MSIHKFVSFWQYKPGLYRAWTGDLPVSLLTLIKSGGWAYVCESEGEGEGLGGPWINTVILWINTAKAGLFVSFYVKLWINWGMKIG